MMCELLGLNFNKPVRCSISFRGFRHRDEKNPHGWGIARYEGKASQVFKEPIRATQSQLADFVRDYDKFTSKIFIGHVRAANTGEHMLVNTHPFVRTFHSREIVLAHNGTLRKLMSENIRLKFHPVGDTDSEKLLCTLLTRMTERQIPFVDYAKIEELLHKLNEYGKMNIIFSEGDHLYVYRDKTGHTNLCLTERIAPFGVVHLQDEDWDVNLAEEKGEEQRGFVIATQPLTDEKWQEIPAGALYVFKDGVCVYGCANHKDNDALSAVLDTTAIS
jgi:predicted glutamine amidotransferase